MGNKQDNVTVLYTPASNLKKTGDMDVGQVAFHRAKLVNRSFVRTRENSVINRLNKTKEERFPDLREEQLKFLSEKEKTSRKYFQDMQKRQKKLDAEMQAVKEAKRIGYADFLTEENTAQAANDQGYNSDDFM